MKNLYKSFLAIFPLLLSMQTIAQICPESNQPQPKPHFGVHPQIVFSNAWNNINSNYGVYWGSANMGNNSIGYTCVFLDTDGWPRADKNHTFMITTGSDNPDFTFQVGQVMKCRYKGTKSQMTLANNAAVIQNDSEAGGYYNFELKVANTAANAAIKFSINGKVTDVELMLPGYSIGDKRLLTDECKDYLKGVQVLRMMGQSGCNQNFEQKWEHRTPANAPFENTVFNNISIWDNETIQVANSERATNPWLTNSLDQTRSYPWEKAIDLCNYLDKDFYANLPVLADINYVSQLSKLMKQRLKPNLNVYIEIGNELWNFGGAGALLGFGMSLSAVHDMVAIKGDRTIMGGFNGIEAETGSVGNGNWWNGGSNAFDAISRWQAYRLKQFMDEFAKDWGFADKGGVGVRLRAVLAGQLAYGWGGHYWSIGPGIELLEKAFGAGTTNKYLYGLGITHYTNIRVSDNTPTDSVKNMSVDQIFEGFYSETEQQFGEFGQECMDNGRNCEGNELEDVLRIAKQYGLKPIAYAGGHEVMIKRNLGREWIPLNNIVAAYNDPRMYEHTLYTMNKWYSWMGYDALFIKNGFYTQNGYGAGYAVAEKLGQQSQQYKAYQYIMNNPAPSISTERGIVLGKTITTRYMANLPTSYDVKTKNSEQNTLNPDYNSFPYSSYKASYIIKTFSPGKYSMKLNLNSVSCSTCTMSNKLNVYLDNQLVKENWVFPNNPSFHSTDSITFDIPYGIHSLTFKNVGDTKSIILAKSLDFRLLNSVCIISNTTDASFNADTKTLLALPNPNNGNFELLNPLAQSISISITDAQGKVVDTEQLMPSQQKEINLSSYPKGIYYLRPNTNLVKGTKVVVQ